MTTSRLLARLPVPPAWTSAWEQLSARERLLAGAAAAVVLIALAWALLWQPVVEDTLRARREVVQLRAALATARARTEEMAGLQRVTSNPVTQDPRLAIERVLGERVIKGSLTSLEIRDNRAYLTFTAIGFDALIGLLDSIAKSDGLRVIEATLTTRIDPGTVRAEITLAR